MKTAKYEKTNKKNTYNEIYQSSGVEFAIAVREKGVNKQLSPFFKCRDFLSDAFWSVKTKEMIRIWGFSHSPAENFLRGRLRFLAKFPGPTNGIKDLTASRDLLWQIEKDNGIPQTRIYKTAKQRVFLVSAAKFWAQNPTMISFITFIFRQGVNLVKHDLKPDPESFFTEETDTKLTQCTDKHTTKFFKGYDKIKELLSNQKELTEKFGALLGKLGQKNNSDIHNRTGIAAVLGGEFDKMYERVMK